MTINEDFLDALIRHQIGLLRLSGSVRNRVISLLDATEKELAAKIRAAGIEGGATPANIRKAEGLKRTVALLRRKTWKEVTKVWLDEAVALASAEPVFTDNALRTVAPVVLDTALPAVAALKAIVESKPFEGRILKEWADSIATADIRRIQDQIGIGLVQGDTPQQMARRVVGSARLKGRNGVTEITRRNAEALTRTAVNHVANQARSAYTNANADLFTEELYVATLDSRTTPICRSYDGDRFPIGEGPIPPLHFQCRSLRVAVLAAEAFGDRPFKAVTEQMLLREFAAKQGIRAPKARAALPRGTKGKFDDFARLRTRELTGRTPAKVDYQEWLTRQSNEFQDDILGPTRGALFRRGGLTLDRFVDRAGNELTLAELARSNAAAFRAAGFDPDNFR